MHVVHAQENKIGFKNSLIHNWLKTNVINLYMEFRQPCPILWTCIKSHKTTHLHPPLSAELTHVSIVSL